MLWPGRASPDRRMIKGYALTADKVLYNLAQEVAGNDDVPYLHIPLVLCSIWRLG